MPVKLNSSGGGSVTLTTPSTATDYTATFPASTGTVAYISNAYTGFVPNGRLTLVSATPVMSSDQTAKSTIYYTPYNGNLILLYSGSVYTWTQFSEISVALDATNAVSGSIYDLFVYSDSGTIRLGYGPAWTSSTGRGTGAGTTQIGQVGGLWVNSNSITLRYSSVATTVVAANQATYVGSFYATANGQTGMAYYPAAAAGGNNCILGLYNAYNRVTVRSRSSDSTSSWTYTTSSWRSANNNNNNRISWIDGLQQSNVDAQYFCSFTQTGGQTGYASVALDATNSVTNGYNGFYAQSNSTYLHGFIAHNATTPLLGFHYFQAVELATGATITYYGGLTGMQVMATVEM